jgi:hypothetical protein
MPHFCIDEFLAIMMVIPVIGIFFRKLHAKFHKSHHHKCHQSGCHEEHVDHTLSVELVPNPPDLIPISIQEVDTRFGHTATILLMFDRKLLKKDRFPPPSEFVFLLSDDDMLSARWINTFFLWDGKEWRPECPEVEVPDRFEQAITLLRKLVSQENESQVRVEAEEFLTHL